MLHCPRCNTEYQDGATRCSDCDAALVAGPHVEETHPDVTLERVYATGDAALVPLVKSLLDDAGIEYLAKGDTIQDLFGMGRFGAGLNLVTGPVEFLVASEDAPAAREILAKMAENVPEEAPGERA